MVDLHPTEPGLPAGHRWLELGRWSMAWRVALWSAFVGMSGTLLLGLIGLGDHTVNILLAPFIGMFGLPPAPLFGLLAALLGPWLRRFFPFTQGIVFGLLGVLLVTIMMTLLGAMSALIFGWCTPSNDCFTPSSMVMTVLVVIMFAGFPLAIMAGVGLGLAILVSDSARARRICVGLLVGVTIVFLVLHALPFVGAIGV